MNAVLGFIVAGVLIVGLCFGLVSMADSFQCKQKWNDSGLSYKWSVFGGCKVSTDGGKTYIPDAKYRQVE